MFLGTFWEHHTWLYAYHILIINKLNCILCYSEEVGGYSVDDRLLRVEDYHLWFKVYAAGHKLYMLDECLYKMRDDRNAVMRRNWRNRCNEVYVKHVGYKMIGLPCWYQLYTIIPILKHFAPRCIYNYFHRRK